MFLTPLITIIVPIYNSEDYLEECISSITSQTYNNLDIILVDDGATDKSPAICDEWANKDMRVKVIHKKNGGLSDARNAGLDMAKGEYVTFCDSDDVIDQEMIEKLLTIANDNQAKIVSCESLLYENGIESIIPFYHKKKEITIIPIMEYLRGLLDITIDCSVCNKLFKRDLIGSHRFEVGKYNEDILFLFDVLPFVDSIIHTNKGYYKYRVSEGSITHTFTVRSLDQYFNSKKLYDITKKSFPLLIDSSRKHLINTTQTIIRQILFNSKRKSPVFSETFNDAKRELYRNIVFVIISPVYSLRRKVSILLTAIRILFV